MKTFIVRLKIKSGIEQLSPLQKINNNGEQIPGSG